MEHVDELIPAHALGSLDGDDERLVTAHLATCERCRRQLADYESVAASLAYAAPRAVPSEELRTRVLGAIEPVVERPSAASAEPAGGRGRFRWWPRLAAVAVPVLAASVVGLLIWNVSLRNDLDSTRSSFAANPAVHVANVGNVVADSAGNVTLYADLPAAPAGKTYEAWVIPRGGKPRRAGIFSGGNGTTVVRLQTPVEPGALVAATLERAGGADAPTQAPLFSARV